MKILKKKNCNNNNKIIIGVRCECGFVGVFLRIHKHRISWIKIEVNY